jgi:hypothetical protein
MEIYIHLLDLTRNRSRKCNFRPLAGIEPAALRFWLEHCTGNAGPQVRLLARVLKEGVQFWYTNTSTVKRGGGGVSRKRSSGKPLKFTLLHISICSKLVRNFSDALGFVSLCRYASLLIYDIFIQPITPSN